MAWNKEHLAWSSAISILDLKNCVIQAAILQITFGAEQVCPFFPGYWVIWEAAAFLSLNNW